MAYHGHMVQAQRSASETSEPDEWPAGVPRPPSEAELLMLEHEPLETDSHMTQVSLLRDSLRHAMRDRPDVFVGANIPVYFSDLQLKNRDFRAPDLFVVLGAEPRPRNFWVVWREGGKSPDLVVEVLSESTEKVDRTSKRRIYEQVLKVREYFLHDLAGSLEGLRLGPDQRYVPIAPEPDGRLRSDVLDMHFGLVRAEIDGHEESWLRAFRPGGALVPTAAEAERERAETERERANELARELETLRARLATLEGR